MNLRCLPLSLLSLVGLFMPINTVTSHSIKMEVLNTNDEAQSISTLIQALASLNHHVETLKNSCEGQELESIICFEDRDVAALWDKISQSLFSLENRDFKEWQNDCELARSAYYHAKNLKEPEYQETKKYLLNESLSYLYSLWIHALELDSSEHLNLIPSDLNQFAIRSLNSSFEHNTSIPQKIKKAMRPYVIDDIHPVKPILDSIFQASRVTANETSFSNAGFIPVGDVRPRTFIRVASHPNLPNYLFKVYLDNELRKKRGDPSWKWLVRRCNGASKIRKIIRTKNMKRFTVAEKWIYPLPQYPAPNNRKHGQHYALLLVTDMHLVPYKQNLRAWYYNINERDLDELYYIISRAKGSSYRPDNIWYTDQNQFAFIDTEYPDGGPDFSRIRRHLRRPMLKYWDQLVRNGGR